MRGWSVLQRSHFGKQREETQEPVKVEKKQIAVDYLEKYILMNHLNRNALKYIPGMRNKEKKPATICLAYFHNKIMRIIGSLTYPTDYTQLPQLNYHRVSHSKHKASE